MKHVDIGHMIKVVIHVFRHEVGLLQGVVGCESIFDWLTAFRFHR